MRPTFPTIQNVVVATLANDMVFSPGAVWHLASLLAACSLLAFAVPPFPSSPASIGAPPASLWHGDPPNYRNHTRTKFPGVPTVSPPTFPALIPSLSFWPHSRRRKSPPTMFPASSDRLAALTAPFVPVFWLRNCVGLGVS